MKNGLCVCVCVRAYHRTQAAAAPSSSTSPATLASDEDVMVSQPSAQYTLQNAKINRVSEVVGHFVVSVWPFVCLNVSCLIFWLAMHGKWPVAGCYFVI